ncbi:MAG: sodium:calcium antiporter [Pseudomonadales bacterium]
MVADVLLMLLGCASLYVGGDALIRGCTSLGRRLQMSPLVIGLVLVAFGTSAPELAVSLDAAVRGHGDLAAGNVVGSNLINTGLALLVLTVLARLPSLPGLAERDLPVLLLLTLAGGLMLLDGRLQRWEGTLLLGAVVGFLIQVLRSGPVRARSASAASASRASLWKALLLTAVGVALLVIGGEAMVHSGVAIAQSLGMSEATIAMTVTAAGTGIPEISATLMALLRGHAALALGNLVGSNIMNLALVLGLSALVVPLDTPGVTVTPIAVLVMLTLILWLGLFLRQGRQLGWSGD